MKKLTTLLLLIFSLLAFNNCSDDVIGTKDLDYVSFQGATLKIAVVKSSTASSTIKIYTTQTTASDRTFNIKVITASTTALAAFYTVPLTVTVPANTNVGTFTVGITDDVSIGTSGVKLVLGFATQDGLFTGSNITITITRI